MEVDASHFAGAYQDMATQQRLADEEKERLATVVEIRDAGAMGEGLFALQDLQPGELQLSYFGKYYAGFSRYLEDYPNDDGANTMELRGEFFDGTPIDSLARRVNHRAPGNMEFVEDESSPYAQLELIEPVRAGEQLFVDYGPAYAYRAHRFARYAGSGQPQLVGDATSPAQAARLQAIEQTRQNMQVWGDHHLKF